MAKRLDRKVYIAINRAATPKFDRWAKAKYGISGKKLLAKVAAGEGGGTTQRPNISSAGARGPFQFIPSTRSAYKRKYGLDAWRTNTEAAKAAVIHLMGTGVAGYNPGMPSYTNYILKQDVDTGPLKTGRGGRERPRGRTVTKTVTPGIDNSGLRQQAKASYLATRNDPNALLNLAEALKGSADVPARTETRVVRRRGAPVGKVKGGKLSAYEIGKLAQKYGLSVREHPAFDKVDPVHTKGSYHYQKGRKGGRAVDVSGDPAKLRRFYADITRRHGRRLTEAFHDPAGYYVKHGRRVKGAIGGHGSHAHFAV